MAAKNFLMISIDDMRTVSNWGHFTPLIRTPHMDRHGIVEVEVGRGHPPVEVRLRDPDAEEERLVEAARALAQELHSGVGGVLVLQF